ncbi:DUF397 domain-containing protein [Streptomyces sp. NPDC057689]|uniref:DUF397 domain-containing protein n=1 Tax=Streptomyces sp. NPDC057689 TaxID=3346213 RepID=UPI0036B78B01
MSYSLVLIDGTLKEPGAVAAVRGSKRASGPVLVLTPTAWQAFHGALRQKQP